MFLILGIGAHTKFSDLRDTSHCRSLGPLIDAQFLIDESYQMFCSDHCNCYVSEGWLWQVINARYQTNYDVNGTIAVSNIQSCQYFNDTLLYDVKLVKSLQWLEKTYECSGLCEVLPIYLFSDINSPFPPKQPCMTVIQNEARQMSQRFAGLALTSALLLFIMLIELGLLFIGDKTEEKKVLVKKKIMKSLQSPEKKSIIKREELPDHSTIKAKNMQVLEFD